MEKETSNISLEELIKAYNYICQIYCTVIDHPKLSNLTKNFVRRMIKEDIIQEEQRAIKYTLKLKDNETIDPPFEFKIVSYDGIEKLIHLYLVDKDIEISTIETNGMFKTNGLSRLVILISKQVFTMELADTKENRNRIMSEFLKLFLSIINSSTFDKCTANIFIYYSSEILRIGELLCNIFLLGAANNYKVKDFYSDIMDSLNENGIGYKFYKELSERMDKDVNYIVNKYSILACEINPEAVEVIADFIIWYGYISYIHSKKLNERTISDE